MTDFDPAEWEGDISELVYHERDLVRNRAPCDVLFSSKHEAFLCGLNLARNDVATRAIGSSVVVPIQVFGDALEDQFDLIWEEYLPDMALDEKVYLRELLRVRVVWQAGSAHGRHDPPGPWSRGRT